ncbi:hypothetical protein [Streptomyces sp. NPDC001435]|uniref:hypothetical protein n=1 Tax=unclassified Streptomyces TaxID=2593676 RepID=UPI0036BED8F0
MADVPGLVFEGRKEVVFEGAQDDDGGVFVFVGDEGCRFVVAVAFREPCGYVCFVGGQFGRCGSARQCGRGVAGDPQLDGGSAEDEGGS